MKADFRRVDEKLSYETHGTEKRDPKISDMGTIQCTAKRKACILFNVDHNFISMWRSTGRFSLQDFHNSLKNKSCSWCFQESQMHTKKT